MRGRLVAVATVLPLLLAACGTGGAADDAPAQAALKLERHADAVSRSLYGRTPHAS